MEPNKKRTRNSYQLEYINELRNKTKVAFSYFDKTIHLKATKTKGSASYEALQRLIQEKTNNWISYGALVHFFTKEPMIDDGRQVLSYEHFTIETIEKFIESSNAIIQEPQINYPRISESFFRCKIKDEIRCLALFKNLIDNLRFHGRDNYRASAEINIHVCEDLGCYFIVTLDILPQAEVYLIELFNFSYLDKKQAEVINFEVTSSFEKFPIYKSIDNDCLGVGILEHCLSPETEFPENYFERINNKAEKHEIEYCYHIEGYFSEFENCSKTKKVLQFPYIYSRGISVTLVFPNIPKFRNVLISVERDEGSKTFIEPIKPTTIHNNLFFEFKVYSKIADILISI